MTGRSERHKSITDGVRKSFSKKMVYHQNERGINQVEMSQVTCMNQGMFSRYRSGLAIPSLETLIEVARGLDVSLGYLVNPKIKPQDYEDYPCDV